MLKLCGYLNAWHSKPVLRAVYDNFYDRIAAQCVEGMTLEIGGGTGNLKQRLPNVVSSDIQIAKWLDCVLDAQQIPFQDGGLSNIVMVDVLHHLEYPVKFFREADRVLRPGGRVVMIEPAITWGSSVFYRFLHHEPVRMSVDPLREGAPDPSRDPYEANQAIPTLLAIRELGRFECMFPSLRAVKIDWFSLVAYPLSGGFKSWSLMPLGLVQRLLSWEARVEPWIGHLVAFRLMLVIEKELPRPGP